MKSYSLFRGGLYFADPSAPPRESSITAFLPVLSVIPLLQHTGSRANPVVSAGDRVREGMLIGRGQGFGSANVHATVPGRVVKTISWKTAEGQSNDALVIRLEGTFERLGRHDELFPWENLSGFELQRLIAEYGIVEMEGAGRPVSDILYAIRSIKEPVTLVVRCIFDDPWLACDYALCRERGAAVAEGCRIAARAAGANRIVIVVSKPERELGQALAASMGKGDIPVDVALTGSRYPQRNSREVEIALRRYGKKQGVKFDSFFQIGCATAAAIYDAVKLRKPILDRYVAVGGSAVKKPQVMKVRIGTRIGEVFAECGGFVDRPCRIGTGSPLMGHTVTDMDEPVVKTSYAVFAVLAGHTGEARRTRCISCGECRTVCPLGLDPEILYKHTIVPDGQEPSQSRAAECHGCGCCEAVCPSRLPLRTVIVSSALKGN